MTTAQRPTTRKPCDPNEIGKLACGSKRIERQAAVTQEIQAKLDGYRASFATARADYTTAWKAAEADRTAAAATLEKVAKQLRCRLDEDTETCLDRVWGAVRDGLDNCAKGTEGCRVGPCDANDSVAADESLGSLAGRIEDLRNQATTHEATFEDLLEEITKLPERATRAKEEVTTLETDAHAAETASDAPAGAVTSVVRLNARALVAGWRLRHVRGGFDSIDDFLDCLCQALTAVLRTWSAVVILEGEKAYRACVAGADTDSCAVLLADPLTALLDRFVKECACPPPTGT